MTRRRFVTAPAEPSEAEQWLRVLAARTDLGYDEHGRSIECEAPAGRPSADAEPAHRAPQGIREQPPSPPSADELLRAMSHAAVTGDPSWLHRVESGWHPYG
jgi:hypothetical protein